MCIFSREGYTVNTKGVRKPTASGDDGVVANPEDQPDGFHASTCR